jgi:hypothetical protein
MRLLLQKHAQENLGFPSETEGASPLSDKDIIV